MSFDFESTSYKVSPRHVAAVVLFLSSAIVFFKAFLKFKVHPHKMESEAFSVFSDKYFMEQAFKEALKAKAADEVPVGAVVVCNNQIIARAHNQTELLNDVTAHAEILALTAAEQYLGSKYLDSCTLYVTLEPCVMCAGALAWAQLGRLVYAAEDEKRGFEKIGRQLLHPSTKVEFGILQEPCSQLLKDFFKQKRKA